MIPGGIKVIADPHWPKQKPVRGIFTSRAHPFVEWLSKFFPFDPNTYFENVILSYTWNDPIMMGDRVYMSPAQFNELKTQIRDQELTLPYRDRNPLI